MLYFTALSLMFMSEGLFQCPPLPDSLFLLKYLSFLFLINLPISINRTGTQFFFNPKELVVFCHPVGAA